MFHFFEDFNIHCIERFKANWAIPFKFINRIYIKA